ncbi:MAG: deoxyribodipyrimidine photolyase [Planctomycetota bacterium]|nr:MAG: deoxyribodipyrimidine photolyase [Planctomycetota bacterium]
MKPFPEHRIRLLNRKEIRTDGGYVLYWMTANRRLHYNFALQRAVQWARSLGKPLLILEALRCDTRWASDRSHAFLLQGMNQHRRELEGSAVGYFPFVEKKPGEGKGLLQHLANHAATVIADDSPAFIFPAMLKRAASLCPVPLEAVDSCGLVPLQAPNKAFHRAVDFRRYCQKELEGHLQLRPLRRPLPGSGLPPFKRLPAGTRKRWPQATAGLLSAKTTNLQSLPLDHEVTPLPAIGGEKEARKRWRRFMKQDLDHYGEPNKHLLEEVHSGLSPYLHFGHLSSHEIIQDLYRRAGGFPDSFPTANRGSVHGWWGLPEAWERFLDQVITWRELGFQFHHRFENAESYESVPVWARRSLAKHQKDRRSALYSLETLEAAETGSKLWNAMQRQLITEGRIHGYLRMLWGKQLLAWFQEPEQAFEALVHLNNRFALDGRDPNSYSGISWCFGRFDRPWGPERPIYGNVRYMNEAGAGRKFHLAPYLDRFV